MLPAHIHTRTHTRSVLGSTVFGGTVSHGSVDHLRDATDFLGSGGLLTADLCECVAADAYGE
jgi:hypothetical protein